MSPDSDNPGLDRVRYELRAIGARTEGINPLRTGIHSRGYLPHVKKEGAEYFITFRLCDSIPKEVLMRYEAEQAEALRRLYIDKGVDLQAREAEIKKEFRRKVERYLDKGAGACHLAKPLIAEMVQNALKFFHQQRYLLREWVVMPNHIHVLLWPMPNSLLSDIVKSWKQFTSRSAKTMLGLGPGPFWQRECYNHWVRNDEERARIARYIRTNPVNARLTQKPEDWRWSSAWASPS